MDPRTDPYNVLTKQLALAKTPAEREAAERALELWCERNAAGHRLGTAPKPSR